MSKTIKTYNTKMIETDSGKQYSCTGHSLDDIVDSSIEMTYAIRAPLTIKITASAESGEETVFWIPESRTPTQIRKALDSMRTPPRFIDSTSFETYITKSGNSLIVKVTEGCKMMGLGYLDEVSVTLDRIRFQDDDNHMLRIFADGGFSEIDVDDVVGTKGNATAFNSFVDHMNLVGVVEHHSVHGWAGMIDSKNGIFVTGDGERILVSTSMAFPETIEDGVPAGVYVEYYPGYNWVNPDKPLAVFRLKRD